jgi:hypothetical protein
MRTRMRASTIGIIVTTPLEHCETRARDVIVWISPNLKPEIMLAAAHQRGLSEELLKVGQKYGCPTTGDER